jgi:hypothetical protein
MRKSKSAPSLPPTPSSSFTSSEEKDNKPVHHIRYGSVKATIWRNDSAKGIFHTVTVTRSYRDESNVWHDTGSFHFKDLPHLAKAITDSHSWIAWQERQLVSQTKSKGGGS